MSRYPIPRLFELETASAIGQKARQKPQSTLSSVTHMSTAEMIDTASLSRLSSILTTADISSTIATTVGSPLRELNADFTRSRFTIQPTAILTAAQRIRANMKGFERKYHHKFPQEWAAVALRWRLSPYLGIPQEPFQVFRRPNTPVIKGKLGISRRTLTNGKLEFRGKIYYQVIFNAKNPLTSAATIKAVDDKGKDILGESVTIQPGVNIQVRFKAPNIAAIKTIGAVEVSGFGGTTMFEMVNLRDWELFEHVGLPYQAGQTQDSLYKTNIPQGPVSNPMGGDAACKYRVDLGNLFFDPPPTSHAGISIPKIEPPKGEEVYQDITQSIPENLLDLLTKMFKNTNQGSFRNRQIHYRDEVVGTGIHQPSSGTTTDDTKFEVPLAGTTLMSAAMDMWASLGLGFGTTDVADYNRGTHSDYLEPTRRFPSPFDYMVTAKFKLPIRRTREFAALSRHSLFTGAVQLPNMNATMMAENRPLNRDNPYSEDLALNWLSLPNAYLPVSYIIARCDDGSNAKFLNEKRTFSTKSYYGFVPAKNPEADPVNQLIDTYVDPLNTVPYTGSRTVNHLKAPTDVFGRWGNWIKSDYTLNSRPPEIPRMLSVDLKLDSSTSVGKTITGKIEIQFAWDWDDRSPHFIEIAGKFVDPSIDPTSITVPTGIQTSNGGAFLPRIQIHFGSTNLNHHPTVIAPYRVKKMPHNSEDGKNRKYKLTIPNVSVNFTSKNRHSFVAYARASEQVNPTIFSSFSPAAKGTTNNPLPEPPVAITGPTINWTALSDATGYARYELSFPSTSDAAGYVIYEATELALRDAIGLPTLTTTDIISRANDLLNNSTIIKAKDAFSRKNKDLLPSPKVTLNLPAVASSLYIYCVTNVTSEQVESDMSNWVLVAVPHLTKPAPPILSAKITNSGIHLTVEPYGSTKTKSIELYRTRSELLVSDINIMGKPVAYDNDTRWHKLDNSGNPIINPNDFAAEYQLTDIITPSWLPYYYRAAAFGDHQPANGIIKGRSKSSNLIQITAIPSDPPDLANLTLSKSGANLRIQFYSRAERWNAPLGNHRIQILTVDRTASAFKEIILADSRLPHIEEKTNNSITIGEFKRVSLTADRRWQYECYIPLTDHEIIVRMTDPKFRKSELRSKYVAPPTPSLLDLISLIGKQNLQRLLVTFKSSVPITKPGRGQYNLEIYITNGRSSTLLMKREFHKIPIEKPFISEISPESPSIHGGHLTILPGLERRDLARHSDLSGILGERITLSRKGTIFRSKRPDSKGRYSYTANIPNKISNPFGRVRWSVVVKIIDPKRRSIEKQKKISQG